MQCTARERSARWRERRRLGALSVLVDVLPAHRRALEAMGLIAADCTQDREAIAWAVARFMDTAPAVASIGAALYPNMEDFMGSEDDTSPQNSEENEQ